MEGKKEAVKSRQYGKTPLYTGDGLGFLMCWQEGYYGVRAPDFTVRSLRQHAGIPHVSGESGNFDSLVF